MNKNYYKQIAIFFVLIIAVGLFAMKFLPQEKEIPRSENRLRVGAGDDITGILLDEIIKLYEDLPTKPTNLSEEDDVSIDFYSFKDC